MTRERRSSGSPSDGEAYLPAALCDQFAGAPPASARAQGDVLRGRARWQRPRGPTEGDGVSVTATHPDQHRAGRSSVTDDPWLALAEKVIQKNDEFEQTDTYRLIAASAERGETCANCGRVFDSDEPVLYAPIATTMTSIFGDIIHEQALCCRDCEPHPEDYFWSQACPVCGRLISYLTGHSRTRGCSRRCSRVVDAERKRRLREEERRYRLPVACAVCDARFVPKRSDACYCSTACRMRAYRQRKAATS